MTEDDIRKELWWEIRDYLSGPKEEADLMELLMYAFEMGYEEARVDNEY